MPRKGQPPSNPFPKGGGGRPKGVKNKFPLVLKEAIERAIDLAGDDVAAEDKAADPKSDKPGGSVGYLRWLARKDTRAFGALVGKCIPTRIEGDNLSGVVIQIIQEETTEPGGGADSILTD